MIETSGLVKVYGSKATTTKALDGVTLRVPQGSIYGLFGHNGAGKTTLISILLGLSLPDEGNGRVLGHDIVRESVQIRKRTGLMPDGFGFYDDLSAISNLTYFGELDGLSKDIARQRAKERLKEFGLQDVINRKVGTFSRGMKQRLGIVQALLKNPELLILDEPTIGVDPEGSIRFRNLITALSKKGVTTLLSTHLLHEIGDICTNVAILKRGKLVANGSIQELSAKVPAARGHRYEMKVKNGQSQLLQELNSLSGVKSIETEGDKIRITTENESWSDVQKLASGLNVEVEYINKIPANLEDLFLFYHGEGNNV